ncbi:MAG: bifunctional DNA-formamidopyrimidine glycosylase/DNA-(apurinic or apyrimidinic site) lyase [Peptococcaceae bacterium]
MVRIRVNQRVSEDSQMPELPEVETIKRSLVQKITGLTIREVKIYLPKIIQVPSPDEFQTRLNGKTFLNVNRRGKYLLFYLSAGLVLVVHLKMTGQLIYSPANAPVARHTHAFFNLSNEHRLSFLDLRQFGRLYLVPLKELENMPGLKKLGVEPLGEKFFLDIIVQELSRRRTRLKPLLLDQSFIAGIGNIYADEILYRASLHPLRPANALKTQEKELLFKAIQEVLQEGIACRGTTIRDYVDGEGRPGNYQYKLKVHGRTGQVCGRCSQPIVRLRIQGRSAYICPYCQKL